MTKSRSKSKTPASPKLDLAPVETIALDKLVLSEANVRRVTTGLSIEALADSIARRSLLQSLSVRPILDEAGAETGTYEVQAGGRRLRALQLLVKQKRLAKDAPIPCIARRDGIVEDDSLAENTDRQSLHPLDQFRAFAALRAKGQPLEDIAAAYGVTATVVRQRLRLASANPILLAAYAENALSLEQLMAFCVTEDHARQAQVWELICNGQAHPYAHSIRNLLTESCIEADDPRVICVGLDAYVAAGGPVMRDLFEDDDGGWLQDPALLMRLLTAKLEAKRATILAQGWKWVEICLDTLYPRKQDLVRLSPLGEALTDEEQAHYEALTEEHDALTEAMADDDTDAAEHRKRLGAIEAELAELDNMPPIFAPEDIARSGALISLSYDGQIQIEYGFVKREDTITPTRTDTHADHGDDHVHGDDGTGGETYAEPRHPVPDEDVPGTALSARLIQDLTSYRTAGLRNALGQDYDTAFLALLHALCLKVFYPYAFDSCLQINLQTHFPAAAPGLGELAAAKAIEERHADWQAKLPRKADDLWDALVALDRQENLEPLFAHCVSLSINAVREPNIYRSSPIRHADQLAAALSLDMGEQGFITTTENYLGRVTKAHILDAVREAKGESSTQLIDHLKKSDMAKEAERLIADTGWLPEALRTPGLDDVVSVETDAIPSADLPAFLTEADDTAVVAAE